MTADNLCRAHDVIPATAGNDAAEKGPAAAIRPPSRDIKTIFTASRNIARHFRQFVTNFCVP
jgi:hypothetical protein